MDPFVFRTFRKEVPRGIVQVDTVGTAAIMIHRRVIEKMPFPVFKFYFLESGEIMLTEDHYFCWKAELMGFECWADMSLQCSHYKLIDLAGVKQRIIAAFEGGMKYQQSLPPKEEPKIIIPHLADVVDLIPKQN
jgi:hypothetical protein